MLHPPLLGQRTLLVKVVLASFLGRVAAVDLCSFFNIAESNGCEPLHISPRVVCAKSVFSNMSCLSPHRVVSVGHISTENFIIPLPDIKIHFLPLSAATDLGKKSKYKGRFDVAYFSHRYRVIAAVWWLGRQGLVAKTILDCRRRKFERCSKN